MSARHRRAIWRVALLLVGAAWAGAAWHLGFLEPGRLGRGLANTWQFAAGLIPPRLEPLPALAVALVETLEIAFVGTLLGFVMAVPAALFAARNVFGVAVNAPVRLFLHAVRTVPTLLWALVFVVAFGLGPVAGALGIAFYTLGYLGKLMAEAFEGVDGEVLEAVGSVGCNRLQLLRHALLPEAANAMLSQLLFVFEYNVRASTILGFVGAGGIGFYVIGYVQLLQYRNLTTALVLTLLVVIAVDQLSAWIRSHVLPGGLPSAG